MIEEQIKASIRNVPDFPKPGISFKDITTVLMEPALCKLINVEFVERLKGKPVDAIVGIESRGFIFGMMLAQSLSVPFIPARKSGKLPFKTMAYHYQLEYGTATLEMHVDALKKGWHVLLHDDLLATGGTAMAASQLIKMQDANVMGFTFLVELDFLKGREKLVKFSENIISLARYK